MIAKVSSRPTADPEITVHKRGSNELFLELLAFPGLLGRKAFLRPAGPRICLSAHELEDVGKLFAVNELPVRFAKTFAFNRMHGRCINGVDAEIRL